MIPSHTVRLVVDEPSQIGAARREARALATRLDFDDIAAEKVAIVTTEAATNLLKHGKGGEVYLQVTRDTPPGLEVFAVDRGPGFADWNRIRADGFSTAGTGGQGIGSIERNSDYAEFYSNPGQGTVLVARFTASGRPVREPSHRGGLKCAKPGQDVCGDDWGHHSTPTRQTVIVADGLGHGPDAAEASRAAVGFLERFGDAPPSTCSKPSTAAFAIPAAPPSASRRSTSKPALSPSPASATSPPASAISTNPPGNWSP